MKRANERSTLWLNTGPISRRVYGLHSSDLADSAVYGNKAGFYASVTANTGDWGKSLLCSG